MSETTVQQWLSEHSMIVEHNLEILRNLIGQLRGTKVTAIHFKGQYHHRYYHR